MSRVLILGAAAVQADAVTSAQAQGHQVHVCAADRGPASDLADATADFSFADLDRLTAYIQEQSIDLVYSVGSDIAMPVVGRVGETLGLPYFVGESVARRCNDKTQMRQTLADADFHGNPWFHRIEPGQEVPAFTGPAIVKPADSQGQRGITYVDRGAEHTAATAVETARVSSRGGSVIVEEFMAGPEISVNAYLVDGESVFAAVSDRHVWPEYVGLVSGHTTPARTIAEPQREAAAAMALEAARLLGITNGPVYAQAKATPQGPRLIEISPRLDGCHLWTAIRDAYGVNLLDLLWPHLLEGRAPAQLPQHAGAAYDIEFVCAPPGTRAAYDRDDVVRYYAPGDQIRPINGRFEKIGYREFERTAP